METPSAPMPRGSGWRKSPMDRNPLISIKEKLAAQFEPGTFGRDIADSVIGIARDGRLILREAMAGSYTRWKEQMKNNKYYINLLLQMYILKCYPEIKYYGGKENTLFGGKNT